MKPKKFNVLIIKDRNSTTEVVNFSTLKRPKEGTFRSISPSMMHSQAKQKKPSSPTTIMEALNSPRNNTVTTSLIPDNIVLKQERHNSGLYGNRRTPSHKTRSFYDNRSGFGGHEVTPQEKNTDLVGIIDFQGAKGKKKR